MSVDTAAPAAPVAWPVLSLLERRVLGVLVEKAKTTPDTYPMSVNALAAGCNQKSNRDPVLNISEDDVETTLASLQQKGLAIKITGGRVVRWRHNLYENWHLGKVELAIIGELLLRGAQTEGELRGRASRMEPVEDLESLRALLRPMSERGLVMYLSAPERRGTMLTHAFHSAEELASLRQSAGSEPEPVAMRATPSAAQIRYSPGASMSAQSGEDGSSVAELAAKLTAAQREIDELRTLCRQLTESLDSLSAEVRSLRAGSLSDSSGPA
jgi:uncharacterized protein YceH (UPF0502 family)